MAPLQHKRNDAPGGSLPPANPVTQAKPTQADDYVPPQLESGASKLDDICPELMDHLRPAATFCPAPKPELVIALRTFVTNTKPRAGHPSTDLLIDLVNKEAGAASHRASRVAGIIRKWKMSQKKHSNTNRSSRNRPRRPRSPETPATLECQAPL